VVSVSMDDSFVRDFTCDGINWDIISNPFALSTADEGNCEPYYSVLWTTDLWHGKIPPAGVAV
jgi:hypothetical protein